MCDGADTSGSGVKRELNTSPGADCDPPSQPHKVAKLSETFLAAPNTTITTVEQSQAKPDDAPVEFLTVIETNVAVAASIETFVDRGEVVLSAKERYLARKALSTSK